MVSELSVTLIYAHIILNFIAAYFAYVIYKYNRLARGWMNVVFALVVIGFNGIFALYVQLDLFPQYAGLIQFITLAALPFLFSINLVWGMLSMKRNFENFEVLQRHSEQKAKSFNKSKKKRLKR